MNNFQELRTSHSHQALPTYTYSISVPQPHPIQTSFIYRQNQSTLPLTFNPNSPCKQKLKKAPRPKSRGPQELLKRNEYNQSLVFKPGQQQLVGKGDSFRGQLEDFSRTSSSIWDSSKMGGTPQRQQINKINIYQLQPRGAYRLYKQNITRFTETKAYKHVQSDFQDSNRTQDYQNNWKVIDTRDNSSIETAGPHTTYLLQEIQLQRKTINTFQQEVIRLNQEIADLRQTTRNEQDAQANQPRNQLKQKNSSLQIENRKIRQELQSKSKYNSYLQIQCKQYLETSQNKTLALAQLEKTCLEAQKKIKTLDEQLNQMRIQANVFEQELKRKQASLQNNKLQDNQEIDRLNRLIEAQASKLNEAERSSQLDRSQISLLLMKLEGLVERNAQLSKSNAEATRYRSLLEEVEKERQKAEDTCGRLEKQVQFLEGKLGASILQLKQVKEALICKQSFWRGQVDQLVQENQASIRKLNIFNQSKKEWEQEKQNFQLTDKASNIKILNFQARIVQLVKQLEICQAENEKLNIFTRTLKEQLSSKTLELEALFSKQQQAKAILELHLVSCEAQKILLADEIKKIRSQQKQNLQRQKQAAAQQHKQVLQQLQTNLNQQIIKLQEQLQIQGHKYLLQLKETKVVNSQLEKRNNELQSKSEELQNIIALLQENLKSDQYDQKIHLQEGHLPLQIPPNSSTSQQEQNDENYINVDREGLNYLCDLLGAQITEKGILNSIIQTVLQLISWQKHQDSRLQQLFNIFNIEDCPNPEEKLLEEVNSLHVNLSLLCERLKQMQFEEHAKEEVLQLIVPKSVQHLPKQQQKGDKELKFYIRNLQELNQDLNSEVLFLRAALFNSRLVAKDVLGVIEDGNAGFLFKERYFSICEVDGKVIQ